MCFIRLVICYFTAKFWFVIEEVGGVTLGIHASSDAQKEISMQMGKNSGRCNHRSQMK